MRKEVPCCDKRGAEGEGCVRSDRFRRLRRLRRRLRSDLKDRPPPMFPSFLPPMAVRFLRYATYGFRDGGGCPYRNEFRIFLFTYTARGVFCLFGVSVSLAFFVCDFFRGFCLCCVFFVVFVCVFYLCFLFVLFVCVFCLCFLFVFFVCVFRWCFLFVFFLQFMVFFMVFV